MKVILSDYPWHPHADPVYAPNAIIGHRKNSARNGIYYSGIWQELGLKESPAASRRTKHMVLAK